MSFDRILTLQQILKSENNFIAKKSEKILIEHAGKKVGEFLLKNFRGKKILFISGTGNNGEDGKLASIYLNKNNQVSEVFEVNNLKKKKNLLFLFKDYDVVVDCIFGTGLNRKVDSFYKKIIDAINLSNKTIVAIDIPSGIECDTGKILGCAVNADITLCMGFFKPAHFLIPGKKFCGEKKIIKLNLKIPKNIKPKIFLNSAKIFRYLPKFQIDTNKFDKGHVLVVGGEMAGASRMVALAARKIGCGLSTIGVLEKHLKFYNGVEVGTIVKIFNDSLLKQKDVLVVGPGLGKSYEKNMILDLIKNFKGPIIIDADAISMFKENKKLIYKVLSKKKNVILTPHAGEFFRLFKSKSRSKILECVHASKLINNTVLFKGNDTVVAFNNDNVWINDNAKKSLATAGSGDILCGLIAGLIAQKMNFKKAILTAIHFQGELSQIKNNLIAEDFIDSIAKIFSRLKNNN